MTKKIIAIFFAVLMTFGCMMVPAFAGNTYDDLTLSVTTEAGVTNEIKFTQSDDTLIAKDVSLSGDYFFVTTGGAKPTIEITHTNLIGGKTTIDETLTPASNGNIFASVEGLSSLYKYTITITHANALVNRFNLSIIKANKSKSGFTAVPAAASNGTAPVTYYEDIDFTVSGATLTFKEGREPDFTGAKFEFKNDNNACIYAIEGNDVKVILSSPTYTGSAIVYKSNFSSIFSSGISTISFTAKANPIKSVRVSDGNEGKKYHFGEDGSIHGKLSSYYFEPSINFEGMTFEITFKDYVTTIDPDITTTYVVKKDANGCYVDLDIYGKQYIRYEAKATKNANQTISATVYVGDAHFQMDVEIEKANFFEFIGIWFGLLFGKYK